MMVCLCSPWTVHCLGWMGCDSYRYLPECQNRFCEFMAGNWSTTANGNYTYTLNTDDYGLNGSGDWTVTIQNAAR